MRFRAQHVGGLRGLAVLAVAVTVGCAGLVGGTTGGSDGSGDDDLTPVDRPDPSLEPVAPLVRRLTSDEVRFTLEDLLGVALTPAERRLLPVDRPLAGFVNTASGQTASPEHALGFSRLADAVVAKPAFAALAAEVAGCTTDDSGCADALVAGLGAALFRRPIDGRERAVYAGLFDVVAGEGVGFEGAAAAVGQAMLQSPGFLYRVEREVTDGFEGLRVVEGYEMASRLSYLLWASAPDDVLYDAAARGDLGTPEGVLAQVDRMLADEARTRRVLDRFLVDWARLASLPDDDGLRGELIETATRFYVDHVEADRALLDLFVEERAMLTPALAEAWGIDAAGEGVRVYDLRSVDDRVGLLAQPGVVAGMTNADGGAIVARGLFLLSQVFCGDVPDPPASLQGEIDDFVDALPPGSSDRTVAEARLERAECAMCHAAFDPLSYGFEALDFRGRHRLEDEHGNPLRTDGWLPPGLSASGGAEPYADLEDWAALVRDNARAQRCFVRRHVEYALGTRLEDAHDGSIEVLRARLESGDGTWESLVRALVVDDLFRTMPVAPAAE